MCRQHEGDADDPAPMVGSSVFQHCGCVSRERRGRYGDSGPAEDEYPVLVRCMCCREIGTLPAQGKAKSCRSVPGSSPDRHSEAKCPRPTKLAGGKGYDYIVVDDYSRVVYTRPLQLKSDAPEASRYSKLPQRMNPRKGCAGS